MPWSVKDSRHIDPTPELDSVEAAVIEIARDDEHRAILVDFTGTAGAVETRIFDPAEAVAPFLDSDEPPSHILVNADGSVSIID